VAEDYRTPRPELRSEAIGELTGNLFPGKVRGLAMSWKEPWRYVRTLSLCLMT